MLFLLFSNLKEQHPAPSIFTQLHPPPPNSSQPPPSSIHFHPAPSTFTQLISASTQLSATFSTIFEPKYCTWLGDFPKFGPQDSKLSILTKNGHSWYLGSTDSESRLRFSKFQPQNPFLGKFGSKKSKLFVLLENWHTWYLKDTDSYSNISF